MWFRNLYPFFLTEGFEHSPEDLERELKGDPLTPCGPQERTREGWVSPFGRGSEVLSHSVAGCHLISMGVEERVLPPAVVREEIARRAEARDGAPGGRTALKQEVEFELLPRAFIKPARVSAIIDPEAGILAVDTAAGGTAEKLLSLLRRSLGSLPAQAFRQSDSLSGRMTAWLQRRQVPGGLELADEVELRSPDGATVRCRRQDLTGDEINGHLNANKSVTQLRLEWPDKLSFTLGEDMVLRRLQFGELVRNEVGPGDSEAEEVDATFAVVALQLRQLYGVLGDIVPGFTPT